eukprot:CAMPEP_0174975644 /NCGR_PEP_ID=MMETSP0004_2-20121128/12562_1 /TAXON_ID=420556 /ORGANISM="Ochromonas sp., Strain CCMP1393" /LENGTH=136 /DNA_ID=CAMNT_0016226527 /DNA_START=342 /DNA_END=752 /DNA_ORIENTATION=-
MDEKTTRDDNDGDILRPIRGIIDTRSSHSDVSCAQLSGISAKQNANLNSGTEFLLDNYGGPVPALGVPWNIRESYGIKGDGIDPYTLADPSLLAAEGKQVEESKSGPTNASTEKYSDTGSKGTDIGYGGRKTYDRK